jgi:hypothetical protein
VYLDRDDIVAGSTPKTTFTAMHQGDGFVFVHDPQCSWFEYDWLDGKTYGSDPTCSDLDKTVYAGRSNAGKPDPSRCIVATTPNPPGGFPPEGVVYMCSPR